MPKPTTPRTRKTEPASKPDRECVECGGFLPATMASGAHLYPGKLGKPPHEKMCFESRRVGDPIKLEPGKQSDHPSPLHGAAMKIEDAKRLALGVYRVFWTNDGGSSLAAVGRLSDGEPWLSPCNWAGSVPPLSTRWDDIEHVEAIELVGMSRRPVVVVTNQGGAGGSSVFGSGGSGGGGGGGAKTAMKLLEELINADITGVSMTITGEQASAIVRLVDAVRTFQPLAKKPNLEPMLDALKKLGDS